MLHVWPAGTAVVVRQGGLLLREWGGADVAALPALFDDEAVSRWTPLASPFGLEEAAAYVDRARSRRTQTGAVQLAVTRDGEQPLGEVLVLPAAEPAAVELGYVVGPAHRGQGLAARAVVAVLPHVAAAGVSKARLTISDDNAASVAVALACGFRPSDATPVPVVRRGVVLSLISWELCLASWWQAV